MIIGDQELGFADPLVAGFEVESRDLVDVVEQDVAVADALEKVVVLASRGVAFDVPHAEIGRRGTLLVVEQALVGEIADGPDQPVITSPPAQ